MDDADDEAAYRRQFESVVEDIEDDGNVQDLNGSSSYTARLMDVLGSDGEDEASTSS